jgi:hypothetical protein
VPQTPHLEQHFTASAAVRDVVIGMADGLTVLGALVVFGFVKGRFTGARPWKSAIQTAFIGSAAAAAAFGIARLVGG